MVRVHYHHAIPALIVLCLREKVQCTEYIESVVNVHVGECCFKGCSNCWAVRCTIGGSNVMKDDIAQADDVNGVAAVYQQYFSTV